MDTLVSVARQIAPVKLPAVILFVVLLAGCRAAMSAAPATAVRTAPTPEVPQVAGVPVLVLQEGHEGNIWNVGINHNGTHVLTVEEEMKLWDARTGNLLTTLTTPRYPRKWAAFSAGGERVVVIDSRGEVAAWDARSGSVLHSRDFRASGLKVLSLSPDATHIIASDELNRVA